MTELQRLVHSLEGTVRATEQLREMKQMQHDEKVAVPSNTELLEQLHKAELAQLSHHAQTAKWFLKVLEILEVKDEL